MEIVSKWGANYLICTKDKLDDNLKKPTLKFGKHTIKPGTKISKFGENKRTSFEVPENSYLRYEGILIIDEVNHCIFSSSWDDDKNVDIIYRFAFSIKDGLQHEFLLIHNKTFQSCRDVDCTKIKFYGLREVKKKRIRYIFNK
jgi:hypothetical protein